MTLYVGPGIKEWEAQNERGITWIASSPLSGYPTYPPLLDLVETTRRAVPGEWAVFEAAAKALAPRWGDLVEIGLEPDRPRLPQAQEIGASDEAPIIQRFLACGMAQVLGRLPKPFGLLIRSAELWDLTSLEFLDRLVLEAGGRIPIAVETSRIPPRSTLIGSWGGTSVVGGRPGKRKAYGPPSMGECILSVCAHGLPLSTLSALGAQAPATATQFEWPDGQSAVALSRWRARRVRAGMSLRDRENWHAAIFDAHSCKGWNYLRRMGHAIASRKADLMLRQHTACLAGMIHLGYDYLYRHLSVLASVLPPGESAAAHLGAARLAPRIWGRGGRQRAVFHYRQALQFQDSVRNALTITHELANLYATKRTPGALRSSRRWYRAAWNLLAKIENADERIHAEIQLCNGLALVDYLENRNEDALSLERRALELISDTSQTSDRVARWAEPLVRTNTAKLLIKRFGDLDGGIALLKTLYNHPEARIRRNCAQNLGRVCFEKSDYAGAVEHLSGCLEGQTAVDLSETEELYDRFVFALSLVASNQLPRAKCQLSRLGYLAEMNGADAVLQIIEKLAKICA